VNIKEYSIREMKGLRLLIKWKELNMYMHYQDMELPTATLRAAKCALSISRREGGSSGKCQPQELGNYTYEVNLVG
jgi:hypothetical protein